jgi:hypothetical protein
MKIIVRLFPLMAIPLLLSCASTTTNQPAWMYQRSNISDASETDAPSGGYGSDDPTSVWGVGIRSYDADKENR